MAFRAILFILKTNEYKLIMDAFTNILIRSERLVTQPKKNLLTVQSRIGPYYPPP